ESPFGEPVNKIRPASVDIYCPGRDADGTETAIDQQRVNLPPNESVAACLLLQRNETLNRGPSRRTIRIKVSGSMIALDNCDRSARPKQTAKNDQSLRRTSKVFQNEANKNVIKGFWPPRHIENVPLL